jgi:hypothetical protein
LADDGYIESIDGKARPEISAEQSESRDGTLHLPTGSDAAGEIAVVGDDEYRWVVHVFSSPFVGAVGS